ncbi:ATPase [Vallitalea okinawensis]|uniref:ATPase n=1 Tax=Vallitalea okinawensis TaxID=2078660 RepID=UPI000CFBD5DA|nr:ATPase [Vallitalea okinawensis]
MENIEKILEQIEEILDNSATVPFSSKIMLEKNEIYDLLIDLRLKLPNEIKQSQWVMEERNKILVEAQKDADLTRNEAESEKEKLVNEHEITRKAYEQSEQIIENAKKVSREMRLGAKEYVDEMLMNLEEQINKSMQTINQQYQHIEKNMVDQLKVIHSNRRELNVHTKKISKTDEKQKK